MMRQRFFQTLARLAAGSPRRIVAIAVLVTIACGVLAATTIRLNSNLDELVSERLDYHRNYLKWWFARLPRAKGRSPEGRENNWWNYVFRFEGYEERGKAKKG